MTMKRITRASLSEDITDTLADWTTKGLVPSQENLDHLYFQLQAALVFLVHDEADWIDLNVTP